MSCQAQPADCPGKNDDARTGHCGHMDPERRTGPRTDVPGVVRVLHRHPHAWGNRGDRRMLLLLNEKRTAKIVLPEANCIRSVTTFRPKALLSVLLSGFPADLARRISRPGGTVLAAAARRLGRRTGCRRRASRIRPLLQQYGQASLVQDRYAERAGLVVLGTGVLPGHHEAGLLRDRACHFPAENLHRLAGLGAAEPGQ